MTNTFVIVHGAWQAPYAWNVLKEKLSKEGYSVDLVQLPGHGEDHSDPKSLHMETYINYVSDLITSMGTKVILAGHSMAGMIISGVAEKIPQQIEKLVYIAAYVPASGQSAYALSLLDKQSLLGASLLVSEDQSEFDVKAEDMINIFCQDGTEEIAQLIRANYKPEPAAPFSDPVTLTRENFGNTRKYYIQTLKDNGIGNQLQKDMIAAAGITDSYELNTGHSPSLSAPGELSDILIEIGTK
ncbi:MAG: alpha/beta fold hydrolase [Pedobacter sp.]|uniref:alpha/beta fold hydrolase n=1 Tax=Pedobacter sp. TaxID=1411316 RepID=UPI003397E9D5